MTTQELERRVAAVLQRRAEEAMNETDTEGLLRQLPDDTDGKKKRDRRRALTAAGVVAVAAAVAVVVWMSGQVPRADDPAPVDQDRVAEDTAASFVETYASLDTAKIAPLLRGAATELWTGPYGDDHWQRGVAWKRAVGTRMVLDSCAALWSAPSGTHVSCTFDLQELHSEQLGLGPYGDNTMTFTIKDGKILDVSESTGSPTNGFWPDVWDPFVRWLSRNHPDEAKQMFLAWPDTQYINDTPRALRLWQQLSQEYADQRSAGG
jgi:hypothetical protein